MIVERPSNPSRSRAPSTAARMSRTPELTALIVSKWACVTFAITRASVVLPVPGGPHRISDGTRSASIARLSTLPGPRMWSCPRIWSSVSGRIRVESGADRRAISLRL